MKLSMLILLIGGVLMNDLQRGQIRVLRNEGISYSQIAQKLGISESTIKTYCRRHGLGSNEVKVAPGKAKNCICCGIPVIQTSGRKEKKFCSDKCRMQWWNSNLDKVSRKAIYEFVCPACKKPFTAYGDKNRKYCCHECYVADRFRRDF